MRVREITSSLTTTHRECRLPRLEVRHCPRSTVSNAVGDPISTSTLWTDPSNPSNQKTLTASYTYNADGMVTSITDPNGITTTSQYDAAGELISAQDQLGNTTSVKYDTSGNVVEQVQSNGEVVENVYDLMGRVIYTTDPFNPQSGLLPDGTYTKYDALGRVVETEALSGLKINITTTPAGNSSSSFVSDTGVIATETTVYAPNGQIQSSTNSSGGTTTYQYNSLGEMTATTDPLGNKSTYKYNQYGETTSETDAEGNTTQYSYDSLGDLTKTTFADGSTITDTYGSLGDIISETDQDGNTTQYAYNAFGQVTEEILPAVPDPSNGGALRTPHTPSSTTQRVTCFRRPTRSET